MQEVEKFYLCNDIDESVVTSGTLKQILEIAAMKKMNAHVLNEFQSVDGEKFPGSLVIVTNNGKPYYLPIFAGMLGSS